MSTKKERAGGIGVRSRRALVSMRKVFEAKPKKCDPDRALAAAEVLAAVWLSEQHCELEHKIDEPPIAEIDSAGHVWVTVKLHVPALDIDLWLDGSHIDHPDNQDEEST